MSLLTGGRGGAPTFGHFANGRLGISGSVSARLPANPAISVRGPMTDPIRSEPLRHELGRRRFMAAIAGSLLAVPLAVEAQQSGKVYRVGVLWHADSREDEGPHFDAFIAGLRERGYIDGRNIVLEHRFPSELPERFRNMAAELVTLRPDGLVGVSVPSAIALKNTGTSIPIVFTALAD